MQNNQISLTAPIVVKTFMQNLIRDDSYIEGHQFDHTMPENADMIDDQINTYLNSISNINNYTVELKTNGLSEAYTEVYTLILKQKGF